MQRAPSLLIWLTLFLSASSRLLGVNAFSPPTCPSIASKNVYYVHNQRPPHRQLDYPTRYSGALSFWSGFHVSPQTGAKWHTLKSERGMVQDNNNDPQLFVSDSSDGDDDDELEFHLPTALGLVAGQSVIILAAIFFGWLAKTPGVIFGLGSSFDLSTFETWQYGVAAVVPLALTAVALDFIEDNVPALQRVTKATQRSVLTLLGAQWLPLTGLVTSLALGIMAGVGEEWLFRGVLQTELVHLLFHSNVAAVLLSSIVFGALHAVTPLYAVLATLASIYFGFLYVWSGNLAVAMVCHAVYDIGALYYAHWTVAKDLTPEQRRDLLKITI